MKPLSKKKWSRSIIRSTALLLYMLALLFLFPLRSPGQTLNSSPQTEIIPMLQHQPFPFQFGYALTADTYSQLYQRIQTADSLIVRMEGREQLRIAEVRVLQKKNKEIKGQRNTLIGATGIIIVLLLITII